jgi:hypothetical protein
MDGAGRRRLGRKFLSIGIARSFRASSSFLFDLFLLAVAADEVADELARDGVGAAFDAGLNVLAEGFGQRDVHAGLRHETRMADIGSLWYCA